MQKKHIGLLGSGNRGRFLVQSLLKQRPDWGCGILVDPHRPSLEQALAELGDRSIPTATSFEAAPAATQIDAWIMAAHERQHLEAACTLFPLGKPIYFEKPIARNLNEGRELIRLQKQHHAAVMIGYECRWAPFYRRAREIMASGRLGKIVHLAAEERLEGGFFAAGWLRGPWRLEAESGSLLLTKCIHDIDYITWLLDAMPTHVSSFGGTARIPARAAGAQDLQPVHASKELPLFAGELELSFPVEGRARRQGRSGMRLQRPE